jgi:hypothetical protein
MEKKLSTRSDTKRLCRRLATFRSARATSYGCLVTLALVGWSGCSRGPAPPPLPSVSPRRAGNEAIAVFDTNNDGKLSGDEVWKSPLLLAAYSRLDANNDSAVTAQEVADLVRKWQKATTRIIRFSPTVYYGGEPLAGATITLEPAPFLGSDFPSASAVTDAKGKARFIGQDRRYPGVYLGLYTVRISKLENGKETIPACYNTKSELAREVLPDTVSSTLGAWFYLNKD